MKIKTKFNKGDIVYFVQGYQTPFYYGCPTCEGEGILFTKNNIPVQCPICKGDKKLTRGGGIDHIVLEGKIVGILCKYFDLEDDHQFDVVYHIKITTNPTFNGVSPLSEHRVYATKEEAEKNLPSGIMGYTS